MLSCTDIHYITLRYIALHYIKWHYITLHIYIYIYIYISYIRTYYMTLHRIAFIALEYITLHWMTLNDITLCAVYISYTHWHTKTLIRTYMIIYDIYIHIVYTYNHKVYIIFQTTAKKHPETKRDTWPWSDQCGPANVLEFVEGFTQEPLSFFVIKAVRGARNVHLLACPRQVGVPVSHLDSWTAWRDNSQVNAQVVRSWCETWQGYIRIIIACFFFLNHHIRQYNAPLKTVIHHNAELGMARTLLRSWRVILLCNSILLISNIP